MRPNLAIAAAIATNRYGFGARPGEIAAAADDPRGWLLAQLRTAYRTSPELEGLTPGREVLATYLHAREERADAKRAGRAEAALASSESMMPHYVAQAAARTRIVLASGASFRERLVHFWSNHFAVSIDKPVCLGLAGALENEAIRPRVDGHFGDLLLAVETHPAMLLYLDNPASVGPNSELAGRVARRADRADRAVAPKRKLGLNENLAREILELHTLGVGGGYTQADVTSFAGVTTGWSVGGGRGREAGGEPGAFVFRPALHEPGSKVVLDRRYAESGLGQGEAVLRDLAQHPATARHLATKLARHFVADDPPAALVERLAAAYRGTGGHLPSVYESLIGWDGAWSTAQPKFKTPVDFAYSALRALEIAPPQPKALLANFEAVGQRHWMPGSPAGWPDHAHDWDGADALMKRIEWSVALAARTGEAHSALATADEVLAPYASRHTRSQLARAASGSQALALLLMSPEFQRR